MVYSPFEVTSSAHTTVTQNPSRLQPRHSKPIKHRILPTSHGRLSQKTEILTKKAGIIAPPSKMDTIEIDLGTSDPSKTAVISTHLSKE
jgi:hypothetical protein